MKRRVIPATSKGANISSSSSTGRNDKSHVNPCVEDAAGPSGLSGVQPKKCLWRRLTEDEISSYALMNFSEEETSSEKFSNGEESEIEMDSETDSEGEPVTPTTLATTPTGMAGTANSGVVWTPEPPQNKASIPFMGPPGLNGRPAATARDYFSVVFPESIYNLILQETERNAEDLFLRNPSPRGRITDWKPLSREDFYVWLGLLFHKGTIKINRMSDYWKTSKFFNIPIFRESMARDRFLGILQALHFAKSPGENDQVPRDRLYKIRPLLDGFREAMENAVFPGRELCIDESMLLWRGRLIFRQYLQGKKHKHGIKMYMLCEPSGLVHRLLIYTGSGDEELGGWGHGDKVVKKLSENFENSGHSVFMNNYYNNVALARDLLTQKTYCTGTLRPNRKENPKEAFGHKLTKGEVSSRWSEEGICVFRWKDKRDIAMISSEFGCNPVATTRPGREKPEAVVAYNKFMGGVDHCDQLLSYYTCEHKTLKWYKKVAIHLFQIMLVNSYILFNKYSGQRKSLYEFRLELIDSLLSSSSNDSVRTLSSATALSHFPAPSEVTNKGKKLQKRCRVCQAKGLRKLVVNICPACEGQPGLCLSPCFQEYHKKLRLL